jgi:hypothetical protein
MPPDEPRSPVPAPPGQHKASDDLAPARRTPRWSRTVFGAGGLLVAVDRVHRLVVALAEPPSSWDVPWAEFDAGYLSRGQRPDGRPGGKPGVSRRARPLLGR